MRRIFIDTNIVIDLLSRREPHYKEAADLFSLADKKKFRLSISALTVANTHYLLSRQMDSAKAKTILRNLNLIVHVVSLDDKIIDLALNDASFTDFEDSIQYLTALETGQDVIITRNLKDFKKSKLPVMTAQQFLEAF